MCSVVGISLGDETNGCDSGKLEVIVNMLHTVVHHDLYNAAQDKSNGDTQLQAYKQILDKALQSQRYCKIQNTVKWAIFVWVLFSLYS